MRTQVRDAHALPSSYLVTIAPSCLDLSHSSYAVRRTLAISCEAVPPSILPAGAQGGTSACHTGAALSFVSCIALFGVTARPAS